MLVLFIILLVLGFVAIYTKGYLEGQDSMLKDVEGWLDEILEDITNAERDNSENQEL